MIVERTLAACSQDTCQIVSKLVTSAVLYLGYHQSKTIWSSSAMSGVRVRDIFVTFVSTLKKAACLFFCVNQLSVDICQ